MRHIPIGFAALAFAAGCSSSVGNVDSLADGGEAGRAEGGGRVDASSDGAMPPFADAQKACADAADAFCARLQACSPFGLAVGYGDVATCKARSVLGCLDTFGAPGTSATAGRTETCAQAFGAISCPDLLAVNLGPACMTAPGMLTNGAPCRDDAQCSSTFCARAASSPCGTCSPLSSAGGPCVNQACSRGLSCPKGGSKCVAPVPGKVGDACTMQEQCDLAHAVGCDTGNTKCIALRVATPGGSCGADSIMPTVFTVCPASGSCSALLGGSCSAAASDGAPCSNADTGPHCIAPAVCASGTCKVPDAASCR